MHVNTVPSFFQLKPLTLLFICMAIVIAFTALFTHLALSPYSLLVLLCGLLLAPVIFHFPHESFLLLLILRNVIDVISDIPVLSFGGIDFNLSSLLGMALIVWGVWYFITRWPIPKFRGRIIILFFILATFISVMTSIEPIGSITESIKMFNLAMLFIISYDYVRTLTQYRVLVTAIACAILIPAIVATSQLFFGTGYMKDIDIANRLLGTYVHPNTFAFALVLSLNAWLLLSNFPYNDHHLRSVLQDRLLRFARKIPYHALLTVLTILLLFTYTRGAWIGAIVSFAMAGLRFHKKQLLIAMSFAVIFSILLPLLQYGMRTMVNYDLMYNKVVTRMSIDEENTASLTWRLRTWTEMSSKLKTVPIFGYGLGSYVKIRESTATYLSDLGLEAHNDYLRLIIEIGYFGAACYAFFFLIVIGSCLWSSWKSDVPLYMKKISFIAGTTFLSFFIMSIADNILSMTPLLWLLWAFMGGTLSLLEGVVYQQTNKAIA